MVKTISAKTGQGKSKKLVEEISKYEGNKLIIQSELTTEEYAKMGYVGDLVTTEDALAALSELGEDVKNYAVVAVELIGDPVTVKAAKNQISLILGYYGVDLILTTQLSPTSPDGVFVNEEY